jgi:hypothetical protein
VWSFNGRVVDWNRANVFTQPSATFAAVERSQIVDTRNSGLTGSTGGLKYFATLRFEDNTTKTLEVANASDRSSVGSFPNNGFGEVQVTGSEFIDGKVYNYILDGDDKISLYRIGGAPYAPVADITGTFATNAAFTGNVVPGTFAGAVSGKIISSDTVVFVQTRNTDGSGSTYTFRAVKGSIPNMGVASLTVEGQIALRNIAGIDNGGLAMMMIRAVPGTSNIPLPGDVTGNWAVSLGASRTVQVGSDQRFELQVLTSDGNVEWLRAASADNFKAYNNVSWNDSTPATVVGETNRFVAFNYETGSNGLASLTSLVATAAAATARGIDAENRVVRSGAGNTGAILTTFHSSTPFYIIDGANSRRVTAEEAAALNINNDGDAGRFVRWFNPDNNTGQRFVLVWMGGQSATLNVGTVTNAP